VRGGYSRVKAADNTATETTAEESSTSTVTTPVKIRDNSSGRGNKLNGDTNVFRGNDNDQGNKSVTRNAAQIIVRGNT